MIQEVNNIHYNILHIDDICIKRNPFNNEYIIAYQIKPFLTIKEIHIKLNYIISNIIDIIDYVKDKIIEEENKNLFKYYIKSQECTLYNIKSLEEPHLYNKAIIGLDICKELEKIQEVKH